MAKANPVSGTTYYLPEGASVPDELPDGVRLVGPGAPQEEVELEDDEAQGEAADLPDEDTTPVRESDPEVEPYDTWTNAELSEELEVRGLAKSGNKDELVTRLRDDDANKDLVEDDAQS